MNSFGIIIPIKMHYMLTVFSVGIIQNKSKVQNLLHNFIYYIL